MSKNTRPSNSREHKTRKHRIQKRLSKLNARVWFICQKTISAQSSKCALFGATNKTKRAMNT